MLACMASNAFKLSNETMNFERASTPNNYKHYGN